MTLCHVSSRADSYEQNYPREESCSISKSSTLNKEDMDGKMEIAAATDAEGIVSGDVERDGNFGDNATEGDGDDVSLGSSGITASAEVR